MEIVATRPELNGRQAMDIAGYGKTMKPSQVLNQPAVQDELAKYGLTKELVVSGIAEDIMNRANDRVGILTLGAKVLKLTSDEQSTTIVPMLNIGVINTETNETMQLGQEAQLVSIGGDEKVVEHL